MEKKEETKLEKEEIQKKEKLLKREKLFLQCMQKYIQKGSVKRKDPRCWKNKITSWH